MNRCSSLLILAPAEGGLVWNLLGLVSKDSAVCAVVSEFAVGIVRFVARVSVI